MQEVVFVTGAINPLRDPMSARIDPLIDERAPWFFRDDPFHRVARYLIQHNLSYFKTLEVAETVRDMSTAELMHLLGTRMETYLEVSGLDRLPRRGPALILANHPTGIADGIILHHLVKSIRPDLFIYANADILRVVPQMADTIVPVEWRLDKRTLTKTRATMAGTRAALERGAMGVIFPSGRLAKRRGLRLYEREWMPSAAMIARKFDLEIFPVNIQARNSALFYLLDLIHPTVRDITLFHEMLNKDRQPYRITVGEPISPRALPDRSEDAIEMLRRATLALGGEDAPSVSLVRSSRKLKWV